MSKAKTALPPTLDAKAARKWLERPQPQAAWLSEEVARRMQQRLDWFRQTPRTWAHWHPSDSGLQVQASLRQRYPKAACWLVEPNPQRAALARQRLGEPWWRAWRRGGVHMGPIPDEGLDMVWANMLLHHIARPLDLMGQWLRSLAIDGFVMFSTLGPDSLRQLQVVHRQMGWGQPGPDLTDMHDWGDMLLEAGFAQPVMDMERITLTYANAWDMLTDLRTLGRNTRCDRFAACRSRGWQQAWLQAVERFGERSDSDGRLQLVFEVIYGHAVKPIPRLPMGSESTVSLRDMRAMLGQTKSN